MSLLLLLSSWLKYQCTTRSSSVWLGSGSENLLGRKQRPPASGCSYQRCHVHGRATERDLCKAGQIHKSGSLLLLAEIFRERERNFIWKCLLALTSGDKGFWESDTLSSVSPHTSCWNCLIPKDSPSGGQKAVFMLLLTLELPMWELCMPAAMVVSVIAASRLRKGNKFI